MLRLLRKDAKDIPSYLVDRVGGADRDSSATDHPAPMTVRSRPLYPTPPLTRPSIKGGSDLHRHPASQEYAVRRSSSTILGIEPHRT
jgi:hypothetical protein